jgi:gas vesicle protein
MRILVAKARAAILPTHPEPMSDERNNGLLGFIAGAAVGAALGVLFAPRSGKETRERIRTKVDDAKSDLDALIERAQDEWAKAKGKAMGTATMTKDEVTDFVRFLFEEGKDLRARMAEGSPQHGQDVENATPGTSGDVRPPSN